MRGGVETSMADILKHPKRLFIKKKKSQDFEDFTSLYPNQSNAIPNDENLLEDYRNRKRPNEGELAKISNPLFAKRDDRDVKYQGPSLSNLKELIDNWKQNPTNAFLKSAIERYDVSRLSNLDNLFEGTTFSVKLDLSEWNPKTANSVNGLFENCRSLENLIGYQLCRMSFHRLGLRLTFLS